MALPSMVSITTDFISVGGNRNPAAADWHHGSGLLAFGANNNIAVWNPLVRVQLLLLWNLLTENLTSNLHYRTKMVQVYTHC